MILISNSIDDTEKIGEKIGKKAHGGMVIAMSGDLGAGKTALVRGIARGMGIKARVTSPTFAIVNEYRANMPLYHFDMYRLTSSDDLYDIGWEDYIRSRGVCAVEWADVVEDALPQDTVRIIIKRIDENRRELSIEGLALSLEEK